jgi:uncharacterized membrane protein YgcG
MLNWLFGRKKKKTIVSGKPGQRIGGNSTIRVDGSNVIHNTTDGVVDVLVNPLHPLNLLSPLNPVNALRDDCCNNNCGCGAPAPTVTPSHESTNSPSYEPPSSSSHSSYDSSSSYSSSSSYDSSSSYSDSSSSCDSGGGDSGGGGCD